MYLFNKLRQSKFYFFVLVVVLFCLKSYIAYQTKFSLGAQGTMQQVILFISPIGFAIFLFGIGLYIKGKWSYWYMVIIDAILSFWLFANILYYREFSDFITFDLIGGSGAASDNLGKSLSGIIQPSDYLVFLDVLFIVCCLIFGWIKIDKKVFKTFKAIIVTIISFLVLWINMSLAYADRPGLLTRTFDNNYIVKYLGLQSYTVYNAVKTFNNAQEKHAGSPKKLVPIKKFLTKNKIAPNIKYTGVAKGKNVFIIHLESLQQFIINKKWKGKEITPNLNKLYHDQNTLAYDNFFNQVGQGKTADAEMMLENSLFGLPEGAAMVTDGTENTFQSLPEILDQHGYTTAAFHGDVPSFWNRDNAYKSFGYKYFFSKQYFHVKPSYLSGYGMKDKIFLKDSMRYVEQLPQPFYAKLITVSNHYPYLISKKDSSIPSWNTGDNTVDPYVKTCHYLDQSIGELIHYLKKTGLYNHSMLVLYGDHYGISNNHKAPIAKILGKKSINNYDLNMFQKVPFMIHMPGLKGGINHKYTGEIDVMPTLLNMMGIKTPKAYQFGEDMLANQRNQIVAFRNGNFVSDKYTKFGSDIYDTKTGRKISKLNKYQKNMLSKIGSYVHTELSDSDNIIRGNLLKFAKFKWFKQLRKTDFNYQKSYALKQLKKDQIKHPNSLIQQNGGKTTLKQYHTDEPGFKN